MAIVFDDEQPVASKRGRIVFDDEVSAPKEGKSILRRGAEAIVDSPALPIAGGVAAGLAALPTGPGAIGAAAIGGAGGEAYRQLAARSLGMDAPGTSAEAVSKIGKAGIEQAAGEATGSMVVAPMAKAVVPAAKKFGGDLFQIVTKMKPQDAATLFKNPKALLPGEFPKAQKAWRDAAESIGLPVDEVSPEMLDVLQGDGKKIVYETYAKIQKGEAVTAKEAQIAKQALDMVVMPVAKTVRKNPQVKTLEMIRDSFQETIGKESPEMRAANKQYGIAATGKKFRTLFPRNTTGDPAYIRSTVLPSILFGSGAASGDPTEGAIRAGAAVAGTSPLAIGSLIAALGSVRGGAPILRRTVTSALADLVGDQLERKKDIRREPRR